MNFKTLLFVLAVSILTSMPIASAAEKAEGRFLSTAEQVQDPRWQKWKQDSLQFTNEVLDFDGSFEQRIPKALREWKKDPISFINQRLEKRGEEGVSKFDPDHVENKDYVDAKHLWRQKICDLSQNEDCELSLESGRALSEANDQPQNLVDSPETMLRKLDPIESRGLLAAKLPETPWSDYYWPIYQGILGTRYAATSKPESSDWMEHFSSVIAEGFDLLTVWKSKDDRWINELSPSEKYDLVIGDLSDLKQYEYFWKRVRWSRSQYPQGYLTPAQWEQGQYYYSSSEDNQVETWMGICHGWAIASYVMDRPEKAVELLAADGKTKVKFYPSDIKALASYLWANARTRSKFVGGRCNDKDPRKDAESGRVDDQDCFDTNPHTWHLSVVNQIGVNQRSFIMDATYDYEVWNQPVYSYRYKYFDPVTLEMSDSWKDVRRAVSDKEFKEQDPYSAYRFKKASYYDRYPERRAHWVVGVAMEVEYVVETHPEQRESDSSAYDAVQSVTYTYDLELNEQGEVVGGEWYTNEHPDFLWNVTQDTVDSKAYYSRYDQMVQTEWDGQGPLPDDWRQQAKRAALDKKPLARIVDVLIEKSQAKEE